MSFLKCKFYPVIYPVSVLDGYKIITYNRKAPEQLQLQNDTICFIVASMRKCFVLSALDIRFL